MHCWLAPLLIWSSLTGTGTSQDGPLEKFFPGAATVFHCALDRSWDRNYDDWPDGWQRRHGSDYPQHVEVKMAEASGPDGSRPLEIHLDGGRVGLNSPSVAASSSNNYVFCGRLEMEGTRYDEAFFTITFLDEAGKPLETITSERVRKTEGWRWVRIGPVTPSDPKTRLAKIGLHVRPTTKEDLSGTVRFNDFRLGSLPRMELKADRPLPFYREGRPIAIECRLSGFSQTEPKVDLVLEDAFGQTVRSETRRLELKDASQPESEKTASLVWKPSKVGPGFYRVRAHLVGARDGLCTDQLTLAVLGPLDGSTESEFGWSFDRGKGPLDYKQLGDLVAQAGVGWVKYPLWYGESATTEEVESLIRFCDRLSLTGYRVVGLLNTPPAEVYRRFGNPSVLETADLFAADTQLWYPSLDAVLKHFSARILWWQLGRDGDRSFVGCRDLTVELARIEKILNPQGLDTHIGIPWDWMFRFPTTSTERPTVGFVSIRSDPTMTHTELADCLKRTDSEDRLRRNENGFTSDQTWVTLAPLAKGEYTTLTRVSDLVRRMIVAKGEGDSAIFATDPLDEKTGLLEPDGTPGELYVPFRTTAMLLGGTKAAGSIQLPGGSQNRLFLGSQTATMVVWNTQSCEEVLYLGKDVRQIDLWGASEKPKLQGDRQTIRVGPLPTFVTGVDPEIARWRQGVRFANRKIPAEFGKPQANRLIVENRFPSGVNGLVRIVTPKSWKTTPAEFPFELAYQETFAEGFEVTLPDFSKTGKNRLRLDFEIHGDEKGDCRFSVYRQLYVGDGLVGIDVFPEFTPSGQLLVTQRFWNRSRTPVDFQCVLLVPGRQRLETRVTNLADGEQETVYRLNDGKSLLGKTLWLRAQEIRGTRQLNYPVRIHQLQEAIYE